MKRKDYPKQVLVKGHWYRVVWLSVSELEKISGRKRARGYCIGDPDRMIYIRTGLDSKLRLSTFWHELDHAMDFEWGLKMSHALIYRRERPMAQLCLDNPWLLPAAGGK